MVYRTQIQAAVKLSIAKKTWLPPPKGCGLLQDERLGEGKGIGLEDGDSTKGWIWVDTEVQFSRHKLLVSIAVRKLDHWLERTCSDLHNGSNCRLDVRATTRRPADGIRQNLKFDLDHSKPHRKDAATINIIESEHATNTASYLW